MANCAPRIYDELTFATLASCSPFSTPIDTLVSPASCTPRIGVAEALVNPAICSPLTCFAMFDTPAHCTPRMSPSTPLTNPATCSPEAFPLVRAESMPKFTPFISPLATLVKTLACTPLSVSTLPKRAMLNLLLRRESAVFLFTPTPIFPNLYFCADTLTVMMTKTAKNNLLFLINVTFFRIYAAKLAKKSFFPK